MCRCRARYPGRSQNSPQDPGGHFSSRTTEAGLDTVHVDASLQVTCQHLFAQAMRRGKTLHGVRRFIVIFIRNALARCKFFGAAAVDGDLTVCADHIAKAAVHEQACIHIGAVLALLDKERHSPRAPSSQDRAHCKSHWPQTSPSRNWSPPSEICHTHSRQGKRPAGLPGNLHRHNQRKARKVRSGVSWSKNRCSPRHRLGEAGCRLLPV